MIICVVGPSGVGKSTTLSKLQPTFPEMVFLNLDGIMAKWTTWNAKMKELLVQTQITSGLAGGSWSVTEPHGQLAGQTYQTHLRS